MREKHRAPVGEELQFIVFRVGEREFAIGIMQVERILPYEAPAPGGPAGDGQLAYRDRQVPVVDLRRRLGQSVETQEHTRTMVLDLEGLTVAAVVDQVSEVVRVDSRAIEAPGETEPAAFASGVIARGDRRITVCHAGRLLSAVERAAFNRSGG